MADLTSNSSSPLAPPENSIADFFNEPAEAPPSTPAENLIVRTLEPRVDPQTPRSIIQAHLSTFFHNVQDAIDHIETVVRNPRQGLTAITEEVTTRVSDNCTVANLQDVAMRVREMRADLADFRQDAVDQIATHIEAARQLGRRSCFFQFMSASDAADDAQALIENDARRP